MTSNPYPIQIKKKILFNLIYGLILILLICLFVGIFFRGFLFSAVFIFFTIIMGIVLVIQIVWRLLYLNSIKYSLDKQDLTFKGGVVSRFEKVIPYSKIQHAIIYKTFWQRILGLSSLSIETARESGQKPTYGRQTVVKIRTGPFIPDLNKEDAEKLKNYIISISNKKYKSIAGV